MPRTSMNGFTLIELLIVIGIFALIAVVAPFMSFDDFRADQLREERRRVVGFLTEARHQAMVNEGQSPHGFCVKDGNYVFFEGSGCMTAASLKSESTDIPQGVLISGLPGEGIVFDALSGGSNWSGSFTLTADLRVATVGINSLGLIDW